MKRPLPGPLSLILLCFIVMFCAANFVSYFAFGHTPHILDGASYVFQARTFLKGFLYGPLPQPLLFFTGGTLIMSDGKWYSLFPPGHPLMLMPWVALGIPWITNPLLGALSVVLIYFYGKIYYNRNIGIISMVLAAVSPVIVFMSSEFMAHTTCMFFVLIFAILFRKSLSSTKVWPYALSGFALGMVVLTRPFTGMALSIPFIARLLLVAAKRRPRLLAGVAAFFFMLMIVGLIYMGYNTATTGSPFKFGHQMGEWGKDGRLGFGERISEYHQTHMNFTFFDGLAHIPFFLGLFNEQLHGWPVPDLIFVALVLLMFRRSVREDFFQLAVFFSVAGAYVFYWYIDGVFGPRFVYETAPMLIVLSARGLTETAGMLKKYWPSNTRNSLFPAASVGLLVLCLTVFSLFKTFPALYDRYSNNYVGAKCNVCDLVRQKDIHDAVVLIRSNHVHYVSNLIMYLNSPLLDTDIIYARDWKENNELIRLRFPDRDIYLYEIYFTGHFLRADIVYENMVKLWSGNKQEEETEPAYLSD